VVGFRSPASVRPSSASSVTGVGAGLLLLGFAIAELLTPVASR
jgi:hypothetical protein